MKFTKCDMCGARIEQGKCSCGFWREEEELEPFYQLMKAVLEKFHEEKRFTMTADAPHLGCALVLFRGTYKDCKKVERFVHELNGRPYYEQTD